MNYRKHMFQSILFALTCAALAAFGYVDPTTASVVGFVGAVVNVKSAQITNADTAGSYLNKAFLARALVRSSRAIATVTNGDSIASTYRFVRIRSNDVVKAVQINNQSCGAACTGDVGLYATNGGAVVDADFFGSAIDLNTARLAPLDVTRESGAGPSIVGNMEKRVWEALGLAADPQVEYDVAITLVAAAAATGIVSVEVEVLAAY